MSKLVHLTPAGEDYMRDLSERDGNFVIGPSPDFDTLLFLYKDHLDEPVLDTKIGMDLKILREDLNDSLSRIERKGYVARYNKKENNKIHDININGKSI